MPAAVDEAVIDVVVVKVFPDDLAHGIEAVGKGAPGAGRGIVEGGVGAAAVEEAVESAAAVERNTLRSGPSC